jgi:magnesium-transporting ATPase (P-type)
MAARSVSLFAMFNWVIEAFGLFGRGFGRFMLAALLTLVAIFALMVPVVIVLGIVVGNSATSGGGDGGKLAMAVMTNLPLFLGMYGLMLLLMLAFVPPLMVGWMRLCRRIDLGEPADALEVLRPYGDLGLWGRSVAFALVAGVIYIAVMAVIGVVFHGAFTEMMQAQLQAMSGNPQPPHFSGGIVLAYLVMMIVGFVLQVAYGLGFAELALRGTGPLQSLGLALGSTLRNLPKLLVLGFALMVGLWIAMFGVVVVGMVVSFVMMLASKILGVAVILLFYLGLVLCIYPLMFSGQYFAWKGMLGGEAPVSGASPVLA